MSKISRRLAQVVAKELSKNLIPVKTDRGILVGDVEIVSEENIKHIWREGHLLYRDIYLNLAAIKIANMLALRQSAIKIEKVYQTDQEYGRFYVDSQILRTLHQRAAADEDFDRADIYWARYTESKNRAQEAKKRLEALVAN